MRLYCLSSLISIPPQPYKIISYETGADELNLSTTNIRKTLKNLKSNVSNSLPYKLTEICIGYEFDDRYNQNQNLKDSEQQHLQLLPPRKLYVIKIYRDDFDPQSSLTFKLVRGMVKKINLDDKGYAFDLLIATSEIKLKKCKKIYFDTKIRIRCIKNTSDRGLITPEAEKAYNDFSKQIEEFCAIEKINDPNLSMELIQEKAFEKLQPFKLSNSSDISVLRERLRNFQSALNLLCDPQTGCYKNIPINEYDPETKESKICRFNQKAICLFELKETTWYAKGPRGLLKSHAYKYRDCQVLNWLNVKLNGINSKDFYFQRLRKINFEAMDLCLTQIYLHPIFLNINKNQITHMELKNCQIQSLSDEFFNILSPNLDYLNLDNNDITNISKSISKLIQMSTLNLNGNKNLSNDGIPWNVLPSRIEYFGLEKTNISQIPEEIKRLTILKSFKASSNRLSYIYWKGFSPKVENMFIEGGDQQINDIELGGDDRNMRSLEITNFQLKNIDPINLPKRLVILNLSSNHIENFVTDNLQDQLPQLKEIYLQNNKLKKFSCFNIPETLRVINLDKNELTSISDLNFSDIWHKLELIYSPEYGNDRGRDRGPWQWKLNILSLKSNKISYISQKELAIIKPIFNSKSSIFMDGNQISALPKGFEKLGALKILGLSKNKFNFDNGDLTEALWNRLPLRIQTLYLTRNNLRSIPCNLKKYNIKELHVDDCNLNHICPYLHTNIQNSQTTIIWVINISKNPKIKNLPFIPSKIYPMPKKEDKAIPGEAAPLNKILASFGPAASTIILTNKENANFRDLSRTKYTKNVYEFNAAAKIQDAKLKCKCCYECAKHTLELSFENQMDINIDDDEEKVQKIGHSLICYCCASCGQITNEPLFEQYMAMDAILQFQNEVIKATYVVECSYLITKFSKAIFSPPIYYEPSKWKTLVKSRLCVGCKKEFLNKVDIAFEEFNKEKPKKKKIVEENENNVNEDDDTPSKAMEEPPRRRRGRPHKQQVTQDALQNSQLENIEDAPSSQSQAILEQTKRKRGRPRKHEIQQPQKEKQQLSNLNEINGEYVTDMEMECDEPGHDSNLRPPRFPPVESLLHRRPENYIPYYIPEQIMPMDTTEDNIVAPPTTIEGTTPVVVVNDDPNAPPSRIVLLNESGQQQVAAWQRVLLPDEY